MVSPFFMNMQLYFHSDLAVDSFDLTEEDLGFLSPSPAPSEADQSGQQMKAESETEDSLLQWFIFQRVFCDSFPIFVIEFKKGGKKTLQ